MPCRVPKRRFSCGAPQHLTKNQKKSEKRQQFQFLSPIHRNFCNVTWKVPFPTPVHIQQNIQRPIKEPFHRYHSGDCAADSAATRQQSHRRQVIVKILTVSQALRPVSTQAASLIVGGGPKWYSVRILALEVSPTPRATRLRMPG